jgi:hypothetical protein
MPGEDTQEMTFEDVVKGITWDELPEGASWEQLDEDDLGDENLG